MSAVAQVAAGLVLVAPALVWLLLRLHAVWVRSGAVTSPRQHPTGDTT